MNLEKSIAAHVRKAGKEPDPRGRPRDVNHTKKKCVAQVGRLLTRLKRKFAVTALCITLGSFTHFANAQNGTGPGSVDLPFTGHTNVTLPVTAIQPRPNGGYFIVQQGYDPSGAFYPWSANVQAVDGAMNKVLNYSIFVPAKNSSSSGSINSILPLPDGRIYLTGHFPFGVFPYNNGGLVRLNTNGSVDTTFVPNFNASPQQPMALQQDGKILVSVSSVLYNGFTKYGLLRFSNDGTLDTAFHYAGTGPNDAPQAMLALPNGKIMIGGTFTNINGIAKLGIARLNADGTLDASFALDTNPGGYVCNLVSAPGGRIFAVGKFTSLGGLNATNLARMNADGSLDSSFIAPSFIPGPSGSAFSVPNFVVINVFASGIGGSLLLAQPDGKVVVGGSFTNVAGSAFNYIVRLNSDGSLDTTFNPGSGIGNIAYGYLGSGPLLAMTQQPDGKYLVGGVFDSVNGVGHRFLARLNGDGGIVVNQTTNSTNIALDVTPISNSYYQWQLNGTNILGATNSSYTVTNLTTINAGLYSVAVSNSTGVTVSQSTVLRSFGDLKMYAGMAIAGQLGDKYRIDAADILPGVTNWVTVTNLTHPGGVFLYTDPNSPGRPQRYYRAVLLP